MRCAIYGRVSTSKQDNENQLAQLRQFAASQKWELIWEQCDEVSGSTSDRPAFKALFAAASRREFDVVLFWALDRFSREGVLETLQHLQTLTSYGVEWRSLTEQYLDSTGVFRDAVISILATIAKQERVRRSERTKAGLERVRSLGRLGGRPQVEVDPDRVRELRKAGVSWPAIARRLGVSRTTCQRAAKRPALSPRSPKLNTRLLPSRI
jgi:DNA invertase Pin-like site-specific DNA recombinase